MMSKERKNVLFCRNGSETADKSGCSSYYESNVWNRYGKNGQDDETFRRIIEEIEENILRLKNK